jgi:hypothetical protein
MQSFAIAVGKAIVVGVGSHYLTKAIIKTVDAQVAKRKKA